jgi:hypothetical protein
MRTVFPDGPHDGNRLPTGAAPTTQPAQDVPRWVPDPLARAAPPAPHPDAPAGLPEMDRYLRFGHPPVDSPDRPLRGPDRLRARRGLRCLQPPARTGRDGAPGLPGATPPRRMRRVRRLGAAALPRARLRRPAVRPRDAACAQPARRHLDRARAESRTRPCCASPAAPARKVETRGRRGRGGAEAAPGRPWAPGSRRCSASRRRSSTTASSARPTASTACSTSSPTCTTGVGRRGGLGSERSARVTRSRGPGAPAGPPRRPQGNMRPPDRRRPRWRRAPAHDARHHSLDHRDRLGRPAGRRRHAVGAAAGAPIRRRCRRSGRSPRARSSAATSGASTASLREACRTTSCCPSCRWCASASRPTRNRCATGTSCWARSTSRLCDLQCQRARAGRDRHRHRPRQFRRALQIKQKVLAACRVRYLRCPVDHLPSVPELQLLVPQQMPPARTPAPPRRSRPAMREGDTAPPPASARALWQDSGFFQDSFFGTDSRWRPSGRRRANSVASCAASTRREHRPDDGEGRGRARRAATHAYPVRLTDAYGGFVRHADNACMTVETPPATPASARSRCSTRWTPPACAATGASCSSTPTRTGSSSCSWKMAARGGQVLPARALERRADPGRTWLRARARRGRGAGGAAAGAARRRRTLHCRAACAARHRPWPC